MLKDPALSQLINGLNSEQQGTLLIEFTCQWMWPPDPAT